MLQRHPLLAHATELSMKRTLILHGCCIYRQTDRNVKHPNIPITLSQHVLIAGISAPRRSKADHDLPSGRLVSITLFKDFDIPNFSHSFLLMNFGQFLDHDMDRMAIAKLSMDAEGKMFSFRYLFL